MIYKEIRNNTVNSCRNSRISIILKFKTQTSWMINYSLLRITRNSPTKIIRGWAGAPVVTARTLATPNTKATSTATKTAAASKWVTPGAKAPRLTWRMWTMARPQRSPRIAVNTSTLVNTCIPRARTRLESAPPTIYRRLRFQIILKVDCKPVLLSWATNTILATTIKSSKNKICFEIALKVRFCKIHHSKSLGHTHKWADNNKGSTRRYRCQRKIHRFPTVKFLIRQHLTKSNNPNTPTCRIIWKRNTWNLTRNFNSRISSFKTIIKTIQRLRIYKTTIRRMPPTAATFAFSDKGKIIVRLIIAIMATSTTRQHLILHIIEVQHSKMSRDKATLNITWYRVNPIGRLHSRIKKYNNYQT